MQYLFCRDFTNNKTEIPDGQEFLCAELPQTQRDDLERAENALEKAMRSGELPFWLEIVKYCLLLVGIPFGASIFFSIIGKKTTLVQACHTGFFWVTAISLLLGGGLWLLEYFMKKRKERGESVRTANKRLRRLCQSAEQYLGIPANAARMDVLLFDYRADGSEVTLRGEAANLEMRLFREGDRLFLSDGREKYAFPLDDLTGITLWEHGIPTSMWNKDAMPWETRYLKAGVLAPKQMFNGFRFCCLLTLQSAGQDYALAFPAYELSTVSRLTGLRAPQLPTTPKPAVKQKRAAPAIKRPPNDGKVHPLFYWRIPSDANAAFWFTPMSDVEFQAAHPKLYGLLVAIGITLLVLPSAVYIVLIEVLHADSYSGWILLGGIGSFIMGIGLFNVVGAWLHQYLGHIVTLVTIGGGLLMVIVSLLLL